MATARVGTLPVHASVDLVVLLEVCDSFDSDDQLEFLRLTDSTCQVHNFLYGYVTNKHDLRVQDFLDRLEVYPRLVRSAEKKVLLKEMENVKRVGPPSCEADFAKLMEKNHLEIFDVLELGYNSVNDVVTSRLQEIKAPKEPMLSTTVKAIKELLKVTGWSNLLSGEAVESTLKNIEYRYLDQLLAVEVSKSILSKRINPYQQSFVRIKELAGKKHHFTSQTELELTEMLDQSYTFLFWLSLREDVSKPEVKLYEKIKQLLLSTLNLTQEDNSGRKRASIISSSKALSLVLYTRDDRESSVEYNCRNAGTKFCIPSCHQVTTNTPIHLC